MRRELALTVLLILILAWAQPAWAEEPATVTIRLKRGIFHVSAKVYLDGQPLNQGQRIVKSVTVRVPPGRHKVKVVQARYLYRTRYIRLRDQSQTFAARAGQEKRVVIWWPGIRSR